MNDNVKLELDGLIPMRILYSHILNLGIKKKSCVNKIPRNENALD